MGDEIQILSEVEAVRQNPGMYIGSVGEDGVQQLLHELVHNALDELHQGQGSTIRVALTKDSCEVTDDGRGIPTEIHSQTGLPACEVALTRLHAGSKFHRKGKARFSAGLHGVGLSCVNALSSELKLNVRRKGKIFEQSFQRGIPLHPLYEKGPTAESGTSVRFSPDRNIFSGFSGFNPRRSLEFLEDLALLHPGIRFQLEDLTSGSAQERSFYFEQQGLLGLFRKYSSGRRVYFPDSIRIAGDDQGLAFEALINWTTDSAPLTVSFVNSVRTLHGGTHENALRAGVTKAVNRVLQQVGQTRWSGFAAEVEEATEGLIAILNCRLEKPNFEGQTKSRLTNTSVTGPLEHAAFEQTYSYFQSHPQAAALLFERMLETRNARQAARRAGDRAYFQHARKEINEHVYKEQFGARSKNWHDSAAWITHQALLQSHAELCQVDNEAVALDVCCGSGVVGASFKGKVKKVIGLDLTPEMVQLARQRLDEVVQGNVYNLPFNDQTFDLVCTREVLHLLPYPERPVSEIFRVLKPGGQFVVGQILPFSEDDAAWMYRVFKKKQPLIYNMFQEEDFRRLLLHGGFVDIEMTELHVWESIDVWINSYETTSLHRHEIRELFRTAPAEAKAIHPFKIKANGEIEDLWRWCVFSVRKPK